MAAHGKSDTAEGVPLAPGSKGLKGTRSTRLRRGAPQAIGTIHVAGSIPRDEPQMNVRKRGERVRRMPSRGWQRAGQRRVSGSRGPGSPPGSDLKSSDLGKDEECGSRLELGDRISTDTSVCYGRGGRVPRVI